MWRFAVLHHQGVDCPHFDILLETAPERDLTAWRSPQWPITGVVSLTALPEHRRIYLEYEGVVSGNRGFVSRVAEGQYDLVRPSPDEWLVRFADPKLGSLSIARDGRGDWTARPA